MRRPVVQWTEWMVHRVEERNGVREECDVLMLLLLKIKTLLNKNIIFLQNCVLLSASVLIFVSTVSGRRASKLEISSRGSMLHESRYVYRTTPWGGNSNYIQGPPLAFGQPFPTPRAPAPGTAAAAATSSTLESFPCRSFSPLPFVPDGRHHNLGIRSHRRGAGGCV